MGIWYATRESVKDALDVKETARNNSQIDRCIEAASRSVEGQLHRKFYPYTSTRYFPWPVRDSGAFSLYFDEHELVSVSTFLSGGTTITSDDYFLEPVNSGPPYKWVEIDLSSSAFFDSGDTYQRSIAITGV